MRQSTRGIFAVLLSLLFTGTGTVVGAEQSSVTALVNANAIDETFESTKRDQTILIAVDRIVAVGDTSEIEIPRDATVIDLAGKTVIPGLWDAHVHTRYDGIDHLNLLLLHGVTTLRDLGGPWRHVARLTEWREQIAGGAMLGPAIWTGGTVLNNPGAGWSHITVVNSPVEARAAVRRLKSAGADFVKVYSHLSRDNYLAIVDEANKQGLPVDGHVPYGVSPEEASRLGQRAIEHANVLVASMATREPDLDENGRPRMASLVDHLDPEGVATLASVFRTNGTYLVPTVALSQHFADATKGEARVLENEALRFIPSPYLKAWRENFRPRNLEEQEAGAVLARQVTLYLHQNGVPIVAGTDTVKPYFVPGDALHAELEILVAAGLGEGEAIRAATLTPAKMMGVDDSGLVKAGYVADLVILDRNPLEDIRNTRSISMVVRAGRILDRTALDQIATDIEARAARWSGLPSGRDR